ncbi:MAG: hypothetical protein D6731_24800 [Planctomycetota bacterium]|nr:MAG: hypothetical protein D6731_24800 [Planctomycetota bacterium]
MHRGALPMLCLLLAGCPSEPPPPRPKTLAGARRLAEAEFRAAEEALRALDAEAAARAARRAEAGAEAAESLLAGTRGSVEAPVGSDAELAAAEATARAARLAARKARRAADLTAEQVRRRELVEGVLARSYRRASGGAVAAVFRALGAAADRAAAAERTGSIERLPESVRGAAALAARLAIELAGPEAEADASADGRAEPAAETASAGKAGSVASRRDWKAVSLAMARYATRSPARTHLLIALALALTAHDRFALYELSLVDPEALDPLARVGFHVLRGIVLRLNGFPLLAGRDLEAAAERSAALVGPDARPADDPSLRRLQEQGPALLSGVHTLLACYYLDRRDLGKADEQIAHALRVWPANPLAVYLTGEAPDGDGGYRAAAHSLEAFAAGSEGEALAREVARRARRARDATGETPPFLDDGRFLVRAGLWYLAHSAKHSRAAARLQETVENARGFGRRTLDRVRALGGLGGTGD